MIFVAFLAHFWGQFYMFFAYLFEQCFCLLFPRMFFKCMHTFKTRDLQKTLKNKPKKHTEKTTTQKRLIWDQGGPKGDQNTTDKGGKGRDPGWNPPRKKKEYCKNQTNCGERVHAGRKHAGHSEPQHAPLGRVRPGGEFWDAC